jgi:DNA-binding transcriptional MerR regulator
MPYKEKEIEKVRFSIIDAAIVCKVAQSAIRLWDKELPWLKPARKGNENRYYTQAQLMRLLKVSYLRKRGVSIKGIDEAWKMNYLTKYVEFIDKSRNI